MGSTWFILGTLLLRHIICFIRIWWIVCIWLEYRWPTGKWVQNYWMATNFSERRSWKRENYTNFWKYWYNYCCFEKWYFFFYYVIPCLGELFLWGQNEYGQLKILTNEPQVVYSFVSGVAKGGQGERSPPPLPDRTKTWKKS